MSILEQRGDSDAERPIRPAGRAFGAIAIAYQQADGSLADLHSRFRLNWNTAALEGIQPVMLIADGHDALFGQRSKNQQPAIQARDNFKSAEQTLAVDLLPGSVGGGAVGRRTRM